MSRIVLAAMDDPERVPATLSWSPILRSEKAIFSQAWLNIRVVGEIVRVKVFSPLVMVKESSVREETMPVTIFRCRWKNSVLVVVFSFRLRSKREVFSLKELALASKMIPEVPRTMASPLIASAFLTFFFIVFLFRIVF